MRSVPFTQTSEQENDAAFSTMTARIQSIPGTMVVPHRNRGCWGQPSSLLHLATAVTSTPRLDQLCTVGMATSWMEIASRAVAFFHFRTVCRRTANR